MYTHPPEVDWVSAGVDVRAFKSLCHILALRSGASLSSTVDKLVLTAVCVAGRTTTVSQAVDGVRSILGTTLAVSDVKQALLRLSQSGEIKPGAERGSFVIPAQTVAEIEARIAEVSEEERLVRDTWLAQCADGQEDLSNAQLDALWKCLDAYMASAFKHHGVECARLLDPKVADETEASASLGSFLRRSVLEHGGGMELDRVARLVNSFFSTPDARRARYVAGLADLAFTVFALSVDDSTASYIRGGLRPLKLFLDTNVIFGVFGLHENPLDASSVEVARVVRTESFPFSLHCHAETLVELQRTLGAMGESLRRRKWSPGRSRVAIAAGVVAGLDRKYHEINSQGAADVDAFLAKYEHMPDLLRSEEIEIYRVGPEAKAEKEERHLLVAEYQGFMEEHRPDKSRPYDALNHDIAVWMTLRSLRNRAESGLRAGAMFVTCDYFFKDFERRVLVQRGERRAAVLPNHLLQLFRPFLATTDDFDRRFVEAFALPEMRAAASGNPEAHARVMTYLGSYRDVPEEVAKSILADQLLMGRVASAANELEVAELIDSSVAAKNVELAEENVALRREKEAERQSHEAAKSEVEGQKVVLVEKERALERKQRELDDTSADALLRTAEASSRVDRLEERLNAALAAVEAEREERDNDRARFRSRLCWTWLVLGAIAGAGVLWFIPEWLGWEWLQSHPKKHGLRSTAIGLWCAALGGTFAPLRKRRWLWTPVLPLLLALIGLLDG